MDNLYFYASSNFYIDAGDIVTIQKLSYWTNTAPITTTPIPIKATTTETTKSATSLVNFITLVDNELVPTKNTKLTDETIDFGIEWRINFEIKLDGVWSPEWREVFRFGSGIDRDRNLVSRFF